jgi:hypothetical protein
MKKLTKKSIVLSKVTVADLQNLKGKGTTPISNQKCDPDTVEWDTVDMTMCAAHGTWTCGC